MSTKIKQKQNKQQLALYRKYRPQTFDEVLGQDVLVSALRGAVQDNTPAHAYIFSGTRGVGKTTLARIFAHELGVSDKDIYELDAASNNSVEDIRDLRESVSTLPFDSEYKVYILDEAHMLSKSAFNALLKTLEEPPSYCIFILATTEPEKLPETIHSRAQHYTLQSPTRELIARVVRDVAQREGYTLGDGADDLIATVANGSFRDGLSHLQKVLAGVTAEQVLVDDVERILGAPQGAVLNDILTGISRGDVEHALGAIHTLAESGVDMRVALELLLERARAVLLLRHGGEKFAKILAEKFGKDDIVELKVLADMEGTKLKSPALLELLKAEELMHSASVKTLPLELAVLNICNK